jgi:hypothetical protein
LAVLQTPFNSFFLAQDSWPSSLRIQTYALTTAFEHQKYARIFFKSL